MKLTIVQKGMCINNLPKIDPQFSKLQYFSNSELIATMTGGQAEILNIDIESDGEEFETNQRWESIKYFVFLLFI